jgi:hypothetical protein
VAEARAAGAAQVLFIRARVVALFKDTSQVNLRTERAVTVVSGIVSPLLAVVVTLGGGWFITTRVTDRWDKIKKRREMDLASAQDFQRLYGEFCAAWKSWDTSMQHPKTVGSSIDRAWECLEHATAIEGEIEALLAKVASERFLSDDDIDVLGAVREGFQTLRKAIREGVSLADRESPFKYSVFKGICVYTSHLLGSSPDEIDLPDRTVSVKSFLGITSPEQEERWIQTAERLNLVSDDKPMIDDHR